MQIFIVYGASGITNCMSFNLVSTFVHYNNYPYCVFKLPRKECTSRVAEDFTDLHKTDTKNKKTQHNNMGITQSVVFKLAVF